MFFAGRPLKRAVALCKATRKAGITWTGGQGYKKIPNMENCVFYEMFQSLLCSKVLWGFRGCRGFGGKYILHLNVSYFD